MKENIFECLKTYLAESGENAVQLAQRARTSKNTVYRAFNGKNISFFAAQRLLDCAGFSLQALPKATPTTPPESKRSKSKRARHEK